MQLVAACPNLQRLQLLFRAEDWAKTATERVEEQSAIKPSEWLETKVLHHISHCMKLEELTLGHIHEEAESDEEDEPIKSKRTDWRDMLVGFGRSVQGLFAHKTPGIRVMVYESEPAGKK